MIKTEITLQDTLAFLNELLSIDPKAIQALVNQRVDCNKQLADHPTVQVSNYRIPVDFIEGQDSAPGYKVGILGVLNGLFGSDAEHWGAIAAVYEEDGKISKFIDNGKR